MKYIVVTQKTLAQATQDLEAAVVRHKFGVLHVHDLQATLKSKGVDLNHACKVFEVCNPTIANTVLSNDMSLNMALPCRISIWEEDNEIKIGTLEPTKLLSALSQDEDLQRVAADVETTIKNIINEAI